MMSCLSSLSLFVEDNYRDCKKPLTMIFNLSISTATVPDKLKIAKAIPILKKNKMQNVFLVSLLPCFSKISERGVFEKCILIQNFN